MEFSDKKAIYLQIAERLCDFILAKKWPDNQRIPAVREIAVMMEVNPNTANRAYDYLQNKGIIYNKRGIGYFVSANGYQKTIELRRHEFLENEVPTFFKTMNLLGLDCRKLEEIFNKQKNNT